MTQDTAFDAKAFRQALGSFATGVTIITARAPDGTPMGLTANSFNSVSLDPPLVLWSLANNAMSFDHFKAASHWAVHVLTADQEALSGRFARRGEDKFAGLEVETGAGDVPLLKDCAARFQCRTASTYQGGDHLIFIGEVLAFDQSETAPLVFHGGRYAHATRRDGPAEKPRAPELAGSFGEDFLGYLLGRSHFQFFGRIRGLLAAQQLGDEAFYLLSTLTLKHVMTGAELEQGMAGVLNRSACDAIGELMARGLAEQLPGRDAEGGAYQLTDQGSATALELIAAAKAVESEVLERLGPGEGAVLKSLLNRLVHAIDPGVEALWRSPD